MGIICSGMQPIGVQREYNRVSQAYREMRDEELENVAAEAYDLTDVARECLSFEISSRGLKVPLVLEPPSETEEPPPSLAEGAEDELALVYTARNMQDLQKISAVFGAASVEYFLGAEHVRDIDKVKARFEGDGVPVHVWKFHLDRAIRLRDEEFPPDPSEDEVDIRCPKCKSDGVILQETEAKATESGGFRWRCDDCGYEWQDDGVTP